MNRPKIIVTIAPNGEPTVKVENVKGRSCTDLTAALQSKLGSVDSLAVTPEYSQTESHNVQNA